MWEGGARFRWLVALLSVGFVLGAYLDAWARQSPGQPMGPWQDAVADAGWFAATGVLVLVLARNLGAGVAWGAALPAGYHLALAGGLLFGVGVLGDIYYQAAFGVERGLEALLSPPHLLQLAGGGLLVSAPLNQVLRQRPERADWPVVLSAALTLSVLTFFTLFANPLSDLWASRRWPAVSPAWVAQDLGVAGLLITASLLVGVMLLMVRSFAVPRGSLTVLCTLNGLCLVVASRHVELLPVMLLTGVGADLLLWWLRPDAAGTTALRVFAAAVPAGYTLFYWVSIVGLEGGSAWPVQLWVGLVMAAALAGLLVSYLAGIRRPRSVVSAEVWGERWPQRHVEVSPAAIKEALDALDDPKVLAASPLLRLSCISAAGEDRTAELRALLIDVVRELAGSAAPRDAEAGQLLVDYYVKKVGSHEVVSERLHLSRPTFYRRLQRGLTLTAERVDELEELAARHAT